MKPVLTFFFDALKPESLPYMPFLNSFAHKKRMRAELGHSVTCHPSMYSGVHPNKHLQWFIWKYDPISTPFKWARVFKYLGLFDNVGSRYFLHKYTRSLRQKNTSWFGVPWMVNLPLKYWPYFNVVEDRSWDEAGYLKDYPTAFDILRKHNVEFEVVGMKKGAGNEFKQIEQNHSFTKICPWTYFFLGSIDPFSHQYTQTGPETIERMRKLDQLVETKYKEYSQQVSDFDVFIFSDHGHIVVDKRVDIHGHFKKNGSNIHRFIHLIDANYARFWFRTDKERATVETMLSTLEGGFVLTPHHQRQYHVDMPDNRYGDMIYYLDRGGVFTKTVWGFNRTQMSMHGYLPDYPDSDGLFLSQSPLVEGTHAELVDILPTLLSSLDLPIPAYVDGQILWASEDNDKEKNMLTREAKLG